MLVTWLHAQGLGALLTQYPATAECYDQLNWHQRVHVIALLDRTPSLAEELIAFALPAVVDGRVEPQGTPRLRYLMKDGDGRVYEAWLVASGCTCRGDIEPRAAARMMYESPCRHFAAASLMRMSDWPNPPA